MKKTLAVACALLVAGSAFAKDPQTNDIQIQATIPSNDHYVNTTTGSWPTEKQNLGYNTISQTLNPFELSLRLKNSNGNITAGLAKAVNLTNGTADIPVTVSIVRAAGTTVELDTSATLKPIYDAPTAPAEGVEEAATLRVVGNPSPTQAAGTYNGTVSLIFNFS